MSDIQSAFFFRLIFNLQAKEYSCNYLDFVITVTFFFLINVFLITRKFHEVWPKM